MSTREEESVIILDRDANIFIEFDDSLLVPGELEAFGPVSMTSYAGWSRRSMASNVSPDSRARATCKSRKITDSEHIFKSATTFAQYQFIHSNHFISESIGRPNFRYLLFAICMNWD